jgi:hypothetical protein
MQRTPPCLGSAHPSDANLHPDSGFAALQKQRYRLEMVLFTRKHTEYWDQDARQVLRNLKANALVTDVTCESEFMVFKGCLVLRDMDCRPVAALPVPRILDIAISCAEVMQGWRIDYEEQLVERCMVEETHGIVIEHGIAVEQQWQYNAGIGGVGHRGWFARFWVPLPMTCFSHGDYPGTFTISAAVRVGSEEDGMREKITFAVSESATVTNLKWADYKKHVHSS